MQANNYLARNFATLGFSVLEPPFTKAYNLYKNKNFLLTSTGQMSAFIPPFSSLQKLVVLLTSRYPHFMLA